MKKAFTLAEVLITLAIIGVVAAMTIPTLISNYQKKEYVARLQKAHSTIANGFKLMLATEGVDNIARSNFASELVTDGDGAVTGESLVESIKNHLGKYFKIVDTCYGTTETACANYSVEYSVLNGAADEGGKLVGMPYFTLSDGTTLILMAYKYPQTFASYMYIDVNGITGPNKFGRDMFFYYINDTDKYFEFRPMGPWVSGNTFEEDPTMCGVPGSTDVSMAHGQGCAARIVEEGWKMNY